MKKLLILAMGLILVGVGLITYSGGATAARSQIGDSPENPIVVNDPSEVPQGAVEDEVSTYETPEKCDTTRSWVLTEPGTDGTSHEEARYKREVPATAEESHLEWAIESRTRLATEGVEYHFRKFTQTRTKAPDVKGFWQNFEPNDKHAPFDGPPSWPTDERGTWSEKKYSGGPQQDASGVFQNGSGNGSWFYRQQTTFSEWSDWSEWTPWEPARDESWQDSPDPIGTPLPHGSGTYSDGTKWERQWQARHDGATRPNGEYTYGEWTEWAVATSGLREEPVRGSELFPENTDVQEWRLIGPVKVVDVEAVPGYTEYFTGAGNEPSLNEEDAIWVPDAQMPGRPWYEFDRRTVVDTEPTEEVVTYYAYSDGKKCDKPDEPEEPEEPEVPDEPKKHDNPQKPEVPTVVDSGL